MAELREMCAARIEFVGVSRADGGAGHYWRLVLERDASFDQFTFRVESIVDDSTIDEFRTTRSGTSLGLMNLLTPDERTP